MSHIDYANRAAQRPGLGPLTSSEKELSGYEYRRVDYVTAGDRRAIEALTASLRSTDA